MPISFHARKYVHREARNLVRINQSHGADAPYGVTVGFHSATPGLSAMIDVGHAWDAQSSVMATIKVAPDAPLGPGRVTFQLAKDGTSLPPEAANLNVVVCESPFGPAAAPTPPANIKAAWAKWNANLQGPIKSYVASGFDTSEAGIWYYDGVDLCLKAGWTDLAVKVADGYMGLIHDRMAGYEVFGQGLCKLYRATGAQKYLDAALQLANTSQFGRADSELYALLPDQMRPVAYQLDLELALAAAFQPPNTGRILDLADMLLGQLDQLFIAKSYALVVPYWVGLAARSLIHYHEQTAFHDARVGAYLFAACNALWQDGWAADQGRFLYSYGVPGTQDDDHAADLNLLIAPMYAWCGQFDRGDRVFIEGVNRTDVTNQGKKASQQVYFAGRYQEWRGL